MKARKPRGPGFSASFVTPHAVKSHESKLDASKWRGKLVTPEGVTLAVGNNLESLQRTAAVYNSTRPGSARVVETKRGGK